MRPSVACSSSAEVHFLLGETLPMQASNCAIINKPYHSTLLSVIMLNVVLLNQLFHKSLNLFAKCDCLQPVLLQLKLIFLLGETLPMQASNCATINKPYHSTLLSVITLNVVLLNQLFKYCKNLLAKCNRLQPVILQLKFIFYWVKHCTCKHQTVPQ